MDLTEGDTDDIQLLCTLHHGLLFDPIELSCCSNPFCRPCIDGLVKCPSCKRSFTKDNIAPHFFLRNVLDLRFQPLIIDMNSIFNRKELDDNREYTIEQGNYQGKAIVWKKLKLNNQLLAKKKVIRLYQISADLAHCPTIAKAVGISVKPIGFVAVRYTMDVESMLKKKSLLSLGEILLVARSVGQALGFIHERGYVHRGVCLSAIHVNMQKNVIASCFLNPPVDVPLEKSSFVTKQEYSAPEVKKRSYFTTTSQESDVYAVGKALQILMENSHYNSVKSKQKLSELSCKKFELLSLLITSLIENNASDRSDMTSFLVKLDEISTFVLPKKENDTPPAEDNHSVEIIGSSHEDLQSNGTVASTTTTPGSSDPVTSITITDSQERERSFSPPPEELYNRAKILFESGTEDNQQLAVSLFTKAGKKGHVRSQNELGVCYERGEGVQKNDKTAVYWYKEAANAEHAMAMNNLGVCFFHGMGVDQDRSEARFWFEKAARKGLTDACYHLAIVSEMDEQYQEATRWYRQAADNGHPLSQNNLSICYTYGEGVTKDLKLAKFWAEKAIENGYTDASANLSILEERCLSRPTTSRACSRDSSVRRTRLQSKSIGKSKLNDEASERWCSPVPNVHQDESFANVSKRPRCTLL
ncbi:hypothetical protein P9112_003311 [Eukaryota sp. TZLM1-RC]